MSESQSRLAEANERASAGVNKFSAKQAELADAALATLANLGYARTSLREIAENTDYSHGVLRYYFTDKLDLITHSIRQYKAVCVRRYDLATAAATTQEELVQGFLEKLAETLQTEMHLHRLWYDLRSQALFEDGLSEDVRKIDQDMEDMVWKIVERYSELGGTTPKVSSKAAYAMFDGLFQTALAKVIAADEHAIPELKDELSQLLPVIASAEIVS